MSRTLKSLADTKVGQIVQFAYYGGTKPGEVRRAEVNEVKTDRIMGRDIAKDEPRQYLFDQAALITVIEEAPAVVIGTTDIEVVTPPTRVRRTPLSFPNARQRLHDQIDALDGDDLAEILGEVDGANRSRFNELTGQVILEVDLIEPHCVVNTTGDVAGINWTNEDGDVLTTVTATKPGTDKIELFIGETEVGPEEFVRQLTNHFVSDSDLTTE